MLDIDIFSGHSTQTMQGAGANLDMERDVVVIVVLSLADEGFYQLLSLTFLDAVRGVECQRDSL